MILLIDNYDSFVFNLARYFQRLGQETHVVRNDAIDVSEIREMAPAAIVLSPGPCTPKEAGCSLSVVRGLWREFPLLGVCLGHQAIAAAFGATIVRAGQPMHGRASRIEHDGRGEFTNIPNPMTVGRYHSLIVDESTLPAELEVSSRTADGVIMALRHASAPVVGWQFHPESILTEHGYALLENFLRVAGIASPGLRSPQPELLEAAPLPQLPSLPVTF